MTDFLRHLFGEGHHGRHEEERHGHHEEERHGHHEEERHGHHGEGHGILGNIFRP